MKLLTCVRVRVWLVEPSPQPAPRPQSRSPGMERWCRGTSQSRGHSADIQSAFTGRGRLPPPPGALSCPPIEEPARLTCETTQGLHSGKKGSPEHTVDRERQRRRDGERQREGETQRQRDGEMETETQRLGEETETEGQSGPGAPGPLAWVAAAGVLPPGTPHPGSGTNPRDCVQGLRGESAGCQLWGLQPRGWSRGPRAAPPTPWGVGLWAGTVSEWLPDSTWADELQHERLDPSSPR